MSKTQILAFAALLIIFGLIARWLAPLTQQELAFMFFLASVIVMLLGYNVPKARTMLVSVGFFVLTSAFFTGFSNWLPQVRGEVPKVEAAGSRGDVTSMSKDDLSKWGEEIIFGRVVSGAPTDGDVGKGQCPLCHTVSGSVRRDRGPSLKSDEETTKVPIADRGAIRIADARYKQAKTVQAEAFPGSGRAASGLEYIAESHACPSCYVAAGFGVKGSNDGESPMPTIHKAPINLSIEELIAVDTYLYTKDDVEPPSAADIKAAYEKFIPEKDRAVLKPTTAGGGGDPCEKIACAKDSPEEIIGKMGCAACHKIPSVEFAKVGAIGPLLAEGANASFRVKSPEYKAAKAAGKAHATSPKEYVIESIMDPSAFIAHGFEPMSPGGKSLMPGDFATKFTYAAVSKLADFLLEQDASKAKAQGLTQHPLEKNKIM